MTRRDIRYTDIAPEDVSVLLLMIALCCGLWRAATKARQAISKRERARLKLVE